MADNTQFYATSTKKNKLCLHAKIYKKKLIIKLPKSHESQFPLLGL